MNPSSMSTVLATILTRKVFLDLSRLACGETRRVSCEKLLYAKDQITRRFQHGKEADTPIDAFADRIVANPSVLNRITVSAVRFHDALWVVEGNRRLWAIKEAACRVGDALEV